MKDESAVDFDTATRIHIGLGVKDLQRTLAFYRTLFGQEATKLKAHYAKFEVADPPLNLSLIEGTGGPFLAGPASHFGIQVKSTRALNGAAERLKRAGYETRLEEQVRCCHALQDKVWATDPEGNPWEVFVVLDNEVEGGPNVDEGCCTQGTCCDSAEQTAPDRCCAEARA